MAKPFYKEKYPHLFEPMYVGKKKIEYKSRVFVAPIFPFIGADADGLINSFGIDFYADLAKGGFASVCVPVEIPKDGGHPRTILLDENIMGFMDMHNLQRIVHAYRCRTSCEIYHAGFCMNPALGHTLISASSGVYNGRPVKAMDKDDMEAVIKLYVDAAFMAKRAGFDALTLHYAHGWLMHQFLSPLTNHRTDEFGGSVENRCRFPRMVLERIREVVGDDMVIELRLNGSDIMPGGITPEDAVQQVLIFEDLIDMVHITCGTRIDTTTRYYMHPTSFVKP